MPGYARRYYVWVGNRNADDERAIELLNNRVGALYSGNMILSLMLIETSFETNPEMEEFRTEIGLDSFYGHLMECPIITIDDYLNRTTTKSPVAA